MPNTVNRPEYNNSDEFTNFVEIVCTSVLGLTIYYRSVKFKELHLYLKPANERTFINIFYFI